MLTTAFQPGPGTLSWPPLMVAAGLARGARKPAVLVA
jgi:hypothetical protein